MPAQKLSDASSAAPAKCERVEPCKWQAAPGVRVQGLCGRIRQNDAGGAGGRINEPPSGMVQRMEQSGDRSEYPQREGHQQPGFPAGGQNQRNFWQLAAAAE